YRPRLLHGRHRRAPLGAQVLHAEITCTHVVREIVRREAAALVDPRELGHRGASCYLRNSTLRPASHAVPFLAFAGAIGSDGDLCACAVASATSWRTSQSTGPSCVFARAASVV